MPPLLLQIFGYYEEVAAVAELPVLCGHANRGGPTLLLTWLISPLCRELHTTQPPPNPERAIHRQQHNRVVCRLSEYAVNGYSAAFT
jgi:hypothetical protein